MATNLGKFTGYHQIAKATVALSGTTSNSVDIAGFTLGAILVPSTFDGTTFKLQSSPDNGQGAGTFYDVYLDGTGAVTLCEFTPGGTGRILCLNTYAAAVASLPNLRIVCGSSQTTSDTVFTLFLKRAFTG